MAMHVYISRDEFATHLCDIQYGEAPTGREGEDISYQTGVCRFRHGIRCADAFSRRRCKAGGAGKMDKYLYTRCSPLPMYELRRIH